MIEKVYRMRGLDLKTSKLVRDPHFSTDTYNLEPDSDGSWICRRGQDEILTDADIIDTFEYVRGSKLLQLKATGLSYLEGAALTTVNYGGDAPATNWSVMASWAEHNGVVYWSDPSGNNNIYKFDGYMAYRAGVSKPVVTATPGAGANFYRLAFGFIDMQGNITYGDFVQVDSVTDGNFTVENVSGTEFWHRYGNTSAPQTISSADLILNLAAHNYEAGDWIRALATNGKRVPIKIESVAGLDITFSAASVGALSFDFDGTIEERLILVIWKSTVSGDYGYTASTEALFQDSTATVTIASGLGGPNDGSPMEDMYDTQVVKGLPPKFKYICMYGETLVGANTPSDENGVFDTTQESELMIGWSDTGIGSSVETFGPLDRKTVGNSDEGDIVGIIQNGDALTILKNRQVYHISGVLIGRQFRETSTQMPKVGGVAHRSIIVFPGGVCFMTAKGPYICLGPSKPEEMQDTIEPFFIQNTLNLDLSRTIGVLDETKEKILFYMPSTDGAASDRVLGFDYKFKDWFFYKDIDGYNGFSIFNDKLYTVSRTGVLNERTTTTNDNGADIAIRYKTGFFHMSAPSLLKKFVKAIIFSLENTGWTALIKSEHNWRSTAKTDSSIVFSTDKQIEERALKNSKVFSMRLVIEGNINDQEPVIDGYELEWEWAQKSSKGEA